MSLNKSARKPKRAVSRIVKKNAHAVVVDKTALLELGRVCAAQHPHALRDTESLSLALSPRALLADLRQMFAAEFPALAGRAVFAMQPAQEVAAPCI